MNSHFISAIVIHTSSSQTTGWPVRRGREWGLFVFYHPGWQTAFINAQKITGHNYQLRVYDIRGKEIFSESGKLNPPYFTKNLNCAGYAKGVYLVRLSTEKESVVKKFVIE